MVGGPGERFSPPRLRSVRQRRAQQPQRSDRQEHDRVGAGSRQDHGEDRHPHQYGPHGGEATPPRDQAWAHDRRGGQADGQSPPHATGSQLAIACWVVLVPSARGSEPTTAYEWTDVSRIVAIGDVHGSYDKLLRLEGTGRVLVEQGR